MSKSVSGLFRAFRLLDERSCQELEGCDLDNADVPFNVGCEVLKVMHPDKNQTVNGIPVIQFSHGVGPYSYCVKRSTFEECTKPIGSENERPQNVQHISK